MYIEDSLLRKQKKERTHFNRRQEPVLYQSVSVLKCVRIKPS
jgi:hypothetical protein